VGRLSCDCGGAGPAPSRARRRAVAALAALMIGALAAPAPAAAHWRPTAAVTAPLTAASLGDGFVLVAGGGTVSADRLGYSIGGLLAGATGYVDLVNTSSVPATLSLTVSMGMLVGVSPASVCSVSWVPATGACPRSSTLIGLTLVLGVASGTYTPPAPVPPGGSVHVKVAVGAVLGGVTLTAHPPVPRPAGERTRA
jgi:hypothetical protein